MGISNSREAKTRMIHVRLPEDVHKKLRIRAAETDVTIQDWVNVSWRAKTGRLLKSSVFLLNV